MSKSQVVLGKEVFVLSPQGEVVRTMVAGIESDEDYSLLNGYTSHNLHWFSFEEAIDVARTNLEARRAKLRKMLRQLAAKDRELQSESYRCSVEGAPYKMVDPGYDESKKFRPRTRKQVATPETYLKPDQRVYAIITPTILPRYAGAEEYRPFSHFVLETSVKNVWFSPDGKALYTFTTPLEPEEFFLSRKKAEAKLLSYSEPGTWEKVPFVSEAEETEEIKKLEDNSVPF